MSGNATYKGSLEISWDDATWILTSSFIIFTMQTGFSLLESGCVTKKNEVSLMMKNIVDPLFSGLAYWTVAYALSLERDSDYKNPVIGWGEFFVDSINNDMGQLFASYTYRLSLSSVTTTIVSGAMAERITFKAYCAFAFLCTIIFALPSYWIWSAHGFLRQLEAVDIAGCSTIHLVGGTSGLIATIILKPRNGRFSGRKKFLMASPVSSLLGTFMLWWGWLGLNMSSTFGISNEKWKYSTRASVATICASASGGINALVLSYLFLNRKFDILIFICGLLSSLVSVSGGCAVFQPWESLVVGWVGSTLSIATVPVLKSLRIDDPINTVAIHFTSAVWGMISVSLFVDRDTLLNLTFNQKGLFRGGSIKFLFIQILSIVLIGFYSATSTYLLLKCLKQIVKLRLSMSHENQGADYSEHNFSYLSSDDSLLPQNNKIVSKRFARKRLKKVLNALKAVHRLSAIKNNLIKRQVKETQTKTVAMIWPSHGQPSAFPF